MSSGGGLPLFHDTLNTRRCCLITRDTSKAQEPRTCTGNQVDFLPPGLKGAACGETCGGGSVMFNHPVILPAEALPAEALAAEPPCWSPVMI